jgi:hypothetical protein
MVEGRYIVKVRLNGYTNPSGKCNDEICFTQNGQQYCCDSYDTDICMGGDRCDSYFVYCLRPLGEVDRKGCFDNETRAKSLYNRDDGRNIDFSQSEVLGLSNPQNLSGLGDAYEVSYYIKFILLTSQHNYILPSC